MNIDAEVLVLLSIFGIAAITILLAVINIRSKQSHHKKNKTNDLPG